MHGSRVLCSLSGPWSTKGMRSGPGACSLCKACPVGVESVLTPKAMLQRTAASLALKFGLARVEALRKIPFQSAAGKHGSDAGHRAGAMNKGLQPLSELPPLWRQQGEHQQAGAAAGNKQVQVISKKWPKQPFFDPRGNE